MGRVVLAGAGEELILRVKQATDGDVHVLPPGRLPSDPARLFEQLLDGEVPGSCWSARTRRRRGADAGRAARRPEPASPSSSWPTPRRRCGRPRCAPASATCSRRRRRGRDPRRRRAGRSGGRQPPPRPAPGAETDRYTGRVITIASPKGGVGKTTVSTNLALGLTAHAPQSTVLVDLDVQFGDCASALAWRRSTRCPTPSTARPARTRWSSRPSSPSTRAGCTPSAGRSPRPPATRSAARTSPACWPRWRGSSATSSSTPRPACPRRRWRRSTGRPTS